MAILGTRRAEEHHTLDREDVLLGELLLGIYACGTARRTVHIKFHDVDCQACSLQVRDGDQQRTGLQVLRMREDPVHILQCSEEELERYGS